MWVGSAGSPHAASMRMPNPTANRARCRFMVHLLRIIPPLVAQLSARPARAGRDRATPAVGQRFGVLHGELDGVRGARVEGLGESDPTARGPVAEVPRPSGHPMVVAGNAAVERAQAASLEPPAAPGVSRHRLAARCTGWGG